MSLEKPWDQGTNYRERGDGGKGQRQSFYRSRLQYLLLEVADGILVSVCQEIQDVVFDVVLLQVVHQVGTVALPFKNTTAAVYWPKPDRGRIHPV